MDIDGHVKIIKNRDNKRGGGVAIYIDSNLTFEPAAELNQIE